MPKSSNFDLIVITGPTASGKTALGVRLARILGGEIISADSRQVYKGMDIGTGKDIEEYGSIPYHLIDIVNPGYEFNVFEFQKRFLEIYDILSQKNIVPIMVGGTGLYIESVLKGYRLSEVPEKPKLREELSTLTMGDLVERLKKSKRHLHNKTDMEDRARLIRAIEIAEHEASPEEKSFPKINAVIFEIFWEREVLKNRITERLKKRISEGLFEEVKRLHESGIPYETLEFYGLEYRYVSKFLKGEINRNDMFQKLKSAIFDFAKRQETWFRRMEKHGMKINRIRGDKEPLNEILKILGCHEDTGLSCS